MKQKEASCHSKCGVKCLKNIQIIWRDNHKSLNSGWGGGGFQVLVTFIFPNSEFRTKLK